MGKIGFLRRKINACKVWRYKYLWLNRKIVSTPAPSAINLEPTNKCNLRCRFCSRDFKNESGFMDMGLYRSIVDQAAAIGVISINHYLAGEPLLHSGLVDMIAYASDKRLFTYMHTNATRLNRELSGKLIDAGLDSISFSFDGENAAEYEANRIGAKYEKTLGNIIGFLTEKQKRGTVKPRTRIQFIREVGTAGNDDWNMDISQSFKDIFKGLPLDGFHQIPAENISGEKPEFSRVTTHYFPCFQLWAGMSVSWDGRVVGCCADLNARFIIGDLREQSILEVWNSEELKDMRRKLIEEKYREVPLCRDCSFLWHDEPVVYSPFSFFKSMVKDVILS